MGNKPHNNFLERLDSKEPGTKKIYEKNFKYFCQFLKVKDPNELITKKFYSQQELQKIEDKIINYITFLKKEGKPHSTIKQRMFAIKFFYRANRINLDWYHISGAVPRPDKAREDLPYTIEEIQSMLDVSNGVRDEFLIYLLVSTGMRIGALPDLRMGDIEPMKPEGYSKHLYKIIVYRGTRSKYYCFTTFECAEALDSYKKYRERNGEQIVESSPLLRNVVNSNLPHKKRSKVKPLKTFVDPVYRIVSKSGIRTRGTGTRHKNMLDHAFRKLFNTKMIEAGVEYNTREFLMGHKISRGLDNSYDKTSDKVRLAEYMKAVSYLTISQEHVYKEKYMEADLTATQKLEALRREKDSEMLGLRQKYGELKHVVSEFVKNQKKIKELEEELKIIRKQERLQKHPKNYKK